MDIVKTIITWLVAAQALWVVVVVGLYATRQEHLVKTALDKGVTRERILFHLERTQRLFLTWAFFPWSVVLFACVGVVSSIYTRVLDRAFKVSDLSPGPSKTPVPAPAATTRPMTVLLVEHDPEDTDPDDLPDSVGADGDDSEDGTGSPPPGRSRLH